MVYSIDKNIVRATVKKRPEDSDKTTVGTLLSFCGSYSMAGAAIMSSKSALRSGIGLLKLCVPDSIYPIVAPVVPEAVFVPYANTSEISVKEKSKYCGAILAGCGLSVNGQTRELVKNIITQAEIPAVLDADALNIVAEKPEILRMTRSSLILTPHNREFSRLVSKPVDEVIENREELAFDFARKHGVIVVLKGHKTIVTDGVDLLYNDSIGNAGMACGGSGDVLAGVIASLAAQGFDLFGCACSGVYLHALAGDIAKEKFGEISMLPTDIINCLPQAFINILGK